MSRAFDDARVCEESVDALIEHVLGAVYEATDTAFIQTIDIELAVDMAMRKIQKLAHWADLEYDGDVGRDEPAMEFLTPDEEPVPALVDPWARGIVQMKKLSAVDVANFKSSNGPMSPSVSSYKSSVFGKSSRKSSASNGSRKSTSSASKDSTGLIVELNEQMFEVNTNENGYMFEMLNKARKLIKMDSKASRDPVAHEDTKSADVARSLKGAGAVLDANGCPIKVIPVKAETLPPYAVPLNFTISAFSNEPVDAKPSSRKAAKKVLRVAGSRVVDDSSHFTATNSLVANIADALKFPLSAGVALRTNRGRQEGLPLESNPRKMSRKDYFSKSAEVAKNPRMTGMSLNESDGAHPLRSADVQQEAEEDEMLQAAQAMTSRFADMDLLEGARPLDPVVSAKEEGADFVVKFSSSNLHDAAAPKQKAQPPPRGAQERPRDRAPLHSQVAPSERKRLPAPGIGKSVGHGLGGGISGETRRFGVADVGGDKVKTNREDILRVLF